MHNFNHKQNFKTKKQVDIKYLYLIIAFFIAPSIAKTQTLSNTESNALFLKYKLGTTGTKTAKESSLLIKISRPLTSQEIELIKPLRSFSIDHLVIPKKFEQQLSSIILAQAEAGPLWKAGENLITIYTQYASQNKQFMVRIVFKPQTGNIQNLLNSLKGYTIDVHNNLIIANIRMSELVPVLMMDVVLFADIAQKAKEEIAINGLDLSVNEISAVHQLYPEVNGSGITISVKEGMFERKDIDIAPNITTLPAKLPPETPHATIMATLASGRGNTFIKGKGAAPFARLTSSDFSNLMPDETGQLNSLKVNVQNHSYGTDIDNLYGIEAVAYDRQVFEADTLIHVFSAGNKGTGSPASGIYKGIPNFANLTGNFKQAKNILVIGGINRENIPEPLSSRGPAYDGRIKPELVALGEDGTSGAAALTSGVVALLQQKFNAQYGKKPSLAVIRSILANSADDLGTAHVDYITGFGKINALQSLQTITDNRFITNTISQDQEFSFPVNVSSAQKEIKVTLAWTDPPAEINSTQGLVNHLDLSLETPSGNIILPWVLNSYPSIDSLSLPATRKIDDRNTIQQLSLENITAGNYIIHVKGRKIAQLKQNFAIAYKLKPTASFNWTFPEQNDAIFAGEDNYLRWSGSFSGQQGKLSASYDNGLSWTSLGNNISHEGSFYKWRVPLLFTSALLKMEINGTEYLSRSFIISAPPILSVGYNCANKLLLHWTPQSSATGYTLFNLQNNTLVAIAGLKDTIAEIDKGLLSSPYLAVSANGAGFSGLKSYTIDYNLQGVSCYVRTFIAGIAGETVKLDLTLGTIYGLRRLIWEKQTSAGVFTRLGVTEIINGMLNYTQIDTSPKFGPQFYRVIMETIDGLQIYSDVLKVNFLKEADFVTYPNPVSDYLSIVSGDFEAYSFSLFNLAGQKLMQVEGSGNKQVNMTSLVSGVYIGIISRNGGILKRIKLIKR